jgi:hypothetical protein
MYLLDKPLSVSGTLCASGWLRMLRALLAYLRVDKDSVWGGVGAKEEAGQ